MSATRTIQIFSISSALFASGGIASLSLVDDPLLKAQLASRSPPSISWLFSRGPRIFPEAAIASGAGFVHLASTAVPSGKHAVSTTLQHLTKGKPALYFAAGVLQLAMGSAAGPFELNEMNEEKWRSAKGSVKDSTPEEDEQTRRFLDNFAKLNMVRAVLLGAGGVLGLMGALA